LTQRVVGTAGIEILLMFAVNERPATPGLQLLFWTECLGHKTITSSTFNFPSNFLLGDFLYNLKRRKFVTV
jgi:hypothetical protein